MSCVNIKSKEFKELVNKTGISSSNLELIIYSYQNNEGHEGEFPSVEYIMNKLTGTNNVVSDAQVELWETKYSAPLKFKDSNSLNKTVAEASRYYRSEAITTWEDNEGNYVMKVAEPRLTGEAVEREYERILANAPRDKEGRLLAPNGRPSNLNERQYAQVRSKAFKRWFGDWESDSENASKVVDENGEPLVVYHESPYLFNEFDTTKKRFNVHDVYGIWTSTEDRKGRGYGKYSYPLFVNIKNPNYTNRENVQTFNELRELENKALKDPNSDGTIIDTFDKFGFEKQIFAKNANQVKSAENVGTFETREDNIYHDSLPTSYKDSRDNTLWNLFESNKDKENITIEAEASIVDIIDRIKDSEYSSIIELLKDKFGNRKSGTKLLSRIKVKLINPVNVIGGYNNSSFKSLNFQGRRAYYNASDKTIYINVAANYNNGNSSGVLLHELMHALTVDRILSNPESKAKFEEILKDYQNSNFDSRYREGEEHKLEEFIANIWTDPVTIENLKKIKSTRTNQSLWEEIKNFFNSIASKLFNDVSNDSLMAEASNELIKLLESPIIVQSKDTFKENLSTNKKETFYSEKEVNQFIKDLKEYEDYSDNDIKVQYFKGNEDLDEYWEVTYGKSSTNNNDPVNYTFYSGGAKGSDIAWSEEAKKLGITTKHYTTNDWDNLPENWKNKLDAEYQEIVSILGRKILAKDSYSGKLVRRDMMQADKADAIFAIGTVASNGYVDGGTGYATTRGIIRGIPVYIFDQADSKWKVWDKESRAFVETPIPILTPNAATVGTREINEDGKKAIREVYEKTFKSTPSTEPKTIEYTPVGKEKQTYTIVGNRIYNKKGEEVFKGENVDRNKIFGNLAVKEGRAVVVTYRDAKYVVNNKNAIMSVTSGKVMQWGEENGDRKNILSLAQVEFTKKNNTQSNTVSTQSTQNQLVAETPTHNYTPSRQEHIESLIEKLDKEDRNFFNQSIELQTQLNNLLSNSLFTLSEIKDIADQMVYWISDTISDIQKDPSKASAFVGLQGKEPYDIKKMSRKDLIKAIGISDLLKGVVNHFGNNINNSMTNARKVSAIKKNWNAVWTFATSTLLDNEGISVVNNTEIIEEDTENNPEPNDPNNETDIDAIRDMVGDSQEHWQIESRTIDILKTASQLMRKFLNECYVLDENGQQVMSSWGVPLRVKPREVVNSLIKWTQGATNIDLMIEALKSKVPTNPWLQEVITKLEDRSGNYADLQSQFFSTIAKNTQIYYIVIKRNNKYVSIPVNNQPALRDAYNRVKALYNASQHPMFTTEGINMESLNRLNTIISHLKTLSNKQPIDKQESLKWIDYSLRFLGYDFTPTSLLEGSISEKDINKIISNLEEISKDLSNNKDNNQYNPFKWIPGGTNTLINNLRGILSIVTEPLEATAISSFYDNGKMYQSNVTPSYLTKLIIKLNTSNNERFNEIMQEEYGKYTWFKQGNTWRTKWLRDLEGDRSILAHKVQLNFNKHSYMRNMTKSEYILSLITEYFSETKKNGKDVGWFRVPMMSNKPSSEFIRGCCFRGDFYKEDITLELKKVFDQELSRIQTVRMRNRQKEDTDYITNFDERGRQFCFLDYMNVYLNDNSTELGRLIEAKLEGKEVDEVRLNELAIAEIRNNMESRVKNILNSWESTGIMKAAKDITGVKSNTRESLENFIWNDTLASINILQLTITDPAFYKNAEDLQKRLAQLHAPGVRCNEKATDYKSREVSDGKLRTIYLSDFDEVISNVIDNITEVFDRKIAKARNDQERKGLEALKESLVGENGAYRKINVTDAQGYSSPTSYRKKALMFGTWSIEAETIYQNLLRGNYKYDQLKQAFQPLKPFVYTQIEKSTNTDNTPLNAIKLPIQNKNSEYLLILADAILQGEKNLSKPNLLRAIYEVMEESATEIEEEEVNGKKFRRKTSKKNGIDTVQFNSAVKSGEMGTLDLRTCTSVEEAKTVLKNAIYVEGDIDKGYNSNHVHEIPAEDYCLQQNIPEHFKNHEQAHGSQPRYITIADLEITDSEGNNITYKVGNRELTAQEFKREYEETISENIEESLLELAEELKLDSENVLERNIALSKILQREILSNSRYGVDLFIACSLNENGEFRIPLGDPIQCKRVEQLINSIIKNRVNKQKIAGGPIVQVSNFGTSRQLSIRFKSKEKDKNGNNILLKSREEFNGTEEQYKQYIKENQAGIAYFECYAPIYSEELFEKFKNADGSIDIKAIEAVNSDLLKMVGYRIPCEDKYSMAPLKIVGFLPREAGDGIMLPYDITTINGSDYDKHQCCSKSM